jgi:hypothetical protein
VTRTARLLAERRGRVYAMVTRDVGATHLLWLDAKPGRASPQGRDVQRPHHEPLMIHQAPGVTLRVLPGRPYMVMRRRDRGQLRAA